jgi:hypothetical protein
MVLHTDIFTPENHTILILSVQSYPCVVSADHYARDVDELMNCKKEPCQQAMMCTLLVTFGTALTAVWVSVE